MRPCSLLGGVDGFFGVQGVRMGVLKSESASTRWLELVTRARDVTLRVFLCPESHSIDLPVINGRGGD